VEGSASRSALQVLLSTDSSCWLRCGRSSLSLAGAAAERRDSGLEGVTGAAGCAVVGETAVEEVARAGELVGDSKALLGDGVVVKDVVEDGEAGRYSFRRRCTPRRPTQRKGLVTRLKALEKMRRCMRI
jgi:hypothetical protein